MIDDTNKPSRNDDKLQSKRSMRTKKSLKRFLNKQQPIKGSSQNLIYNKSETFKTIGNDDFDEDQGAEAGNVGY